MTDAVVLIAAALSSALTVAPARVVLDGAAKGEVRVATTRGVAVVDAVFAPYALDLRGRPRLSDAPRAPRWVSAWPTRLKVGPSGAVVRLAATPPRGAPPGDHPFALVLTTRSPGGRSVVVRLRIGVLVIAHVPGRIVRRLVIGPLRAGRARTLELTIRNAGNVVERLARGELVLALLRRGRVVAHLRPPPRQLLPHSRALVVARLPRSLHGPATVRVSFGSFVHRYPVRV